MSSFEFPEQLTSLVPALIALTAAVAAALFALRLRRQLKLSETRLHKVLAHHPLASAVIDADGRILEFDSHPTQNTPWSSLSVQHGQLVWELPGMSAESAEQLRQTFESAQLTRSNDISWEYVDPGGQQHHYSIALSHLPRHGRGARLTHMVIADRTLECERAATLDQAQALYRTLFRNSPSAIVCFELEPPGVSLRWPKERQIEAIRNARFADCNAASALRLGCKDITEVIGRRMHELLPGAGHQTDLLGRIVDSGYSLQGWYTPPIHLPGDAGGATHHITCAAEFNESNVERLWMVFRDVTDKLDDIDAIALGAERQKSLSQAEEAYFCVEYQRPIDPGEPLEIQAQSILSARLVECNATFASSCNVDDPETLIGRTMRELMPQTARPEADETIPIGVRQYIENGYKLQDYREEFIHPDGTRYVSIINSRGTIRDGKITRQWTMLRDVTEREAQIRYLQRSEARFERMAQQSPALIYRLRLGADFGLEFVSDAVYAITGYPRDHAMFEDVVVNELFSSENLESLLSQLDSPGSPPALTRHRHLAGDIVLLEHRAVPVRDADGTLRHIEGVALDVTERFNSQQQLQTALSEISKLSNALRQENVQLREEIRTVRSFDLIVGNSPKFSKVIDLATRAAPTHSTILILGETGTGKELFARSIHQSSTRSDKPIISVNCAALPPTLIESELFGHTKGAFTGAHVARIGRFEAADGGTLLLDEIGELSLDLQGKLLRVVQEGEFQRIGDNKTIHVDVRLIASTNSDLAAAVERGEFRADLYYRLNVFPIVIPPLRERPEDIPILANHFGIKHCHRLGKTFEAISPELLRILAAHHWPGNVRELESVIERSIIVSQSGMLQAVEINSEPRKPEPRSIDELTQSAEVFERSLKEAERHHILRVLEHTNWVIEGLDGAASRLGIAPSTLRSKMKKLGIARPGIEESEPNTQPDRQLH